MDSVHQDQLSIHLQDDMKRAVDLMMRELNYHPTAFMRMMSEYGGVGAAKRLLAGGGYQYGFEKLFQTHRLGWSVEAHAILPWYSQLFTVDEILAAEDRLTSMDFDIAAYLGAVEVPDWSKG